MEKSIQTDPARAVPPAFQKDSILFSYHSFPTYMSSSSCISSDFILPLPKM